MLNKKRDSNLSKPNPRRGPVKRGYQNPIRKSIPLGSFRRNTVGNSNRIINNLPKDNNLKKRDGSNKFSYKDRRNNNPPKYVFFLVLGVSLIILFLAGYFVFNMIRDKEPSLLPPNGNLDPGSGHEESLPGNGNEENGGENDSTLLGFFKNFLTGFVTQGDAGVPIYYNEGWVGIGTPSPKNTLNVVGSFNVTGSVFTGGVICQEGRVLSTTLNGQLTCVNVPNFSNSILGSGVPGRLAIWNGSNSLTSNPEVFWNSSSQRLILGSSSPSQTKLHVNAVMMLQPLGSAPNCNQNGLLYVSTTKALCYCDGTQWQKVSGSGNCNPNPTPPA